jgi:hypothetical protein
MPLILIEYDRRYPGCKRIWDSKDPLNHYHAISMRHANIRTTLKAYAQVVSQSLPEASDRFSPGQRRSRDNPTKTFFDARVYLTRNLEGWRRNICVGENGWTGPEYCSTHSVTVLAAWRRWFGHPAA